MLTVLPAVLRRVLKLLHAHYLHSVEYLAYANPITILSASFIYPCHSFLHGTTFRTCKSFFYTQWLHVGHLHASLQVYPVYYLFGYSSAGLFHNINTKTKEDHVEPHGESREGVGVAQIESRKDRLLPLGWTQPTPQRCQRRALTTQSEACVPLDSSTNPITGTLRCTLLPITLHANPLARHLYRLS
jgi:hypothetical protein